MIKCEIIICNGKYSMKYAIVWLMFMHKHIDIYDMHMKLGSVVEIPIRVVGVAIAIVSIFLLSSFLCVTLNLGYYRH